MSSERAQSYRDMGLDHRSYVYPDNAVIQATRFGNRLPLLSNKIGKMNMMSVAARLRKIRAAYKDVQLYITIPSKANT